MIENKTPATPVRYGIDIDGVLANFIEAFIEHAKFMGFGKYFPATWEEWTAYDGPEDAKVLFDELYKTLVNRPKFWLDINLLPNAVEDMAKLPPPTVYITARPIPASLTATWLALKLSLIHI